MNQQEFLARFQTRRTLAAPQYDREALARWAAELRAALPARIDALAAQFGQALELSGGKFYTAENLREAGRMACEIARAHAAQSVAAWHHPLLHDALDEMRGAGMQVTLSDAQARNLRDATEAAPIGLTTCDYAIAETGTLLLIGTATQGRLTSLLPITHVAIITPAHFVPTLADALKLLRLARLSSADGRLPSNVSLHSGPSKTADIEQMLTKGVHGPKEVHVILARTSDA